MTEIGVLGVPTNSAGRTDGVARAPAALREAGLVVALERVSRGRRLRRRLAAAPDPERDPDHPRDRSVGAGSARRSRPVERGVDPRRRPVPPRRGRRLPHPAGLPRGVRKRRDPRVALRRRPRGRVPAGPLDDGRGGRHGAGLRPGAGGDTVVAPIGGRPAARFPAARRGSSARATEPRSNRRAARHCPAEPRSSTTVDSPPIRRRAPGRRWHPFPHLGGSTSTWTCSRPMHCPRSTIRNPAGSTGTISTSWPRPPWQPVPSAGT